MLYNKAMFSMHLFIAHLLVVNCTVWFPQFCCLTCAIYIFPSNLVKCLFAPVLPKAISLAMPRLVRKTHAAPSCVVEGVYLIPFRYVFGLFSFFCTALKCLKHYSETKIVNMRTWRLLALSDLLAAVFFTEHSFLCSSWSEFVFLCLVICELVWI